MFGMLMEFFYFEVLQFFIRCRFYRLELEAANAAAEKQKITELRRRSIDHGGMAFKVPYAFVWCNC